MCLPYNFLLFTVDHHDEHQADHLLVGEALLPPEDCVKQLLLQNLIRGREGCVRSTGGAGGETLLKSLLRGELISGPSAPLGVVQLLVPDLHPVQS